LIADAWAHIASIEPRQSLLVIRNGWIAGEWDNVGLGPMSSCTKSLTGLVLAKVLELSGKGLLKKIGYDDFVYRYLPSAWSGRNSRRKLIKVKHLPTMCSEPQLADGPGSLPSLKLPVIHPPETVYEYSSGSVELEGMVIEDASSELLGDFFKRHFSDPVGAESARFHDDW
jgi:CubicO group peptidase (beta-lactamase class C family)